MFFHKFYFLEGSLFSLILIRLELTFQVVCCMFSCGLNVVSFWWIPADGNNIWGDSFVVWLQLCRFFLL